MGREVAESPVSQQISVRTTHSRKKSLLSVSAKRRIDSVILGAKRLGFLSNEYWAEDNLRRALSKMEIGEEEDFRGKTPYYKIPRKQVISSWWPMLSKITTARISSIYAKELLLLEEAQASNISVQSRYKPFSVDGVDKLKGYFNVNVSQPRNMSAWEKTLDWAIRLVPKHSLHSLSASEVWSNTTEGKVKPASDTMDSNTHSGAIHFQHGWKVSPAMSDGVKQRVRVVEQWLKPAAEEYYNRIDSGESIPNVTILFQRLAQKADEKKIKRLVWAVAKPAVLAEKRFVPALQDVFRNIVLPSGVPIGIGLTDPLNNDLACQKAMLHADNGNRMVLGLDYSSFDASQSAWLNQEVYKVWANWFVNGDWLVKFAKQMYENHYVIAPTGIYHPRSIGGPSGLTDTLIRNSFISLLVAQYGFNSGYWDELQTAMFLGDDGNIDAAGLTAERYESCAKEFGLVMNAAKSFNKRGMMLWLQRLHCLGLLGGMMPTMRMLGSVMSHERSVDIGPGGIMEVIRAYGAVDNCALHPAFEEFVHFVAAGDKSYLGINLKSSELQKLGGDAASEERSIQWNLREKALDASDLGVFDAMAVRGVLKGEQMPPIGSYARFVRAYGEERVQTNVHPALRNELAAWKFKQS